MSAGFIKADVFSSKDLEEIIALDEKAALNVQAAKENYKNAVASAAEIGENARKKQLLAADEKLSRLKAEQEEKAAAMKKSEEEKAASSIKKLDELFNKNKELYADELFNKITG